MKTTFRDTEIPGRIHAMQPFLSTGKLPDGTRRWWAVSGPAVELGYLPPRLHASARSAVYVVYSYGTPIAWVTENEDERSRDPYVYHVPDVGYSPTTGRHQTDCVEAWATALKRQGDYRRFPSRGREVVRVPGNAEVYGRERRLRSGGVDDSEPRQSAYDGVSGDAMHYVPSAVHTDGHDRAHP